MSVLILIIRNIVVVLFLILNWPSKKADVSEQVADL